MNTISSELMTNFLPASVMSPLSQFEAAQTSGGNALLFSIGTGGALYVTQETPSGANAQGGSTGWISTDLSTALIQSLPNGAGATVTRLCVAQDQTTGLISVGMVVSTSACDLLYLWLGISNADAIWTALQPPQSTAPGWVSYAFNDSSNPQPNLQIVNLYLSQVATDPTNFVMADILRVPGNPANLVYRYFVNPSTMQWSQTNTQIDLEYGPYTGSSGYTTTIGRISGASVDGLYTAGEVDGNALFIYTPVINSAFPNLPPASNDLLLPNSLLPQALATCRNADGSTDLYVTTTQGSGSTATGMLYYFASTNQGTAGTPTLCLSSTVLVDTQALYAFEADGEVIVWGLNNAFEVFYVTCELGQQSSSAWSLPLPIVSGVDLISPYVNSVSNGNTIFAVGGNTLNVLTRSPMSTIWTNQPVNLAAPGTVSATQINSYTTTIQVLDDNNQPVPNAQVLINTTSGDRVAFFINYLYTVLDGDQVTLTADAMGTLTIIEAATGLHGTPLTISISGASQTINPMANAMTTMQNLNTSSGITSAQFQQSPTNPTPQNLAVCPSTMSSQQWNAALSGASASFTNLSTAQSDLPLTGLPPATDALRYGGGTGVKAWAPVGAYAENAVEVFFGDLWNWLVTGIEAVVTFVESAVEGIWNFIVQVGEDIFYAVIWCAEQLLNAAVWIANQLGIPLQNLINYLGFLFDWTDIINTKKVMENVITCFLNNVTTEFTTFKSNIDGDFDKLKKKVLDWAQQGSSLSFTGLGSSNSSPVLSNSTPAQASSSPGSLVSHHFINNSGQMSLTSTPPSFSFDTSALESILTQVEGQGATVISQLQNLISSVQNTSTFDLGDFLRAIVAIAAEIFLDVVQDIIDLVLEVLIAVADTVVSAITGVWDIPIISAILAFLGIPQPSMLDILCFLGALPATLVYKLAYNAAPFPASDPNTQALITASDFAAIQQIISSAGSSPSASAAAAPAADDSSVSYLASSIYLLGNSLAGILGIVGGFLTGVDAAVPRVSGTPVNSWAAAPSAWVGFVGSSMTLVTSSIYSPDGISDASMNGVSIGLNTACTFATLLSAPPVSGMMPQAIQDSDNFWPVINVIFSVGQLGCSIYHFIELAGDTQDNEQAAAIVGETGNCISYVGRWAYLVAINLEGVPQLVMAAATGVADIAAAGFQIAQPLVYRPAVS